LSVHFAELVNGRSFRCEFFFCKSGRSIPIVNLPPILLRAAPPPGPYLSRLFLFQAMLPNFVFFSRTPFACSHFPRFLPPPFWRTHWFADPFPQAVYDKRAPAVPRGFGGRFCARVLFVLIRSSAHCGLSPPAGCAWRAFTQKPWARKRRCFPDCPLSTGSSWFLPLLQPCRLPRASAAEIGSYCRPTQCWGRFDRFFCRLPYFRFADALET